jgi:hypothetical protein
VFRPGKIAYLVEEDVLPVSTFCCEAFEVAILTNAMLLAELLPKLAANYSG